MKEGINMNLTDEQQGYIYRHLNNPEKTFSIAAIAKKLVQNNNDISIEANEAELAALIMNIGETSDEMNVDGINIYSKEYGPWDDKAKELNKNRGEISVRMAEEQKIALSETQKEAIISTSRGGTLNELAIALKVAQTMEAIKHTRWSRGQEKQPAKNIHEVTEILEEEIDFMLRGQEISDEEKGKIKSSMINSAKKTYIQEKHAMVQKTISMIVMWTNRELDMNPSVADHVGNTTLTEERIKALLDQIPEDKIDDFCYKLTKIIDTPVPTALLHEDMVGEFISSWEKEEKAIKKEEPDER